MLRIRPVALIAAATAVFSFFFVSAAVAQSRAALRLAVKDYPTFSRTTLSTSLPLAYTLEKKGASIIVHIETRSSFRVQREPSQSRFIKSLSWAKEAKGYKVIVEAHDEHFNFDHYALNNPYQIVIDVRQGAERLTPEIEAEDAPLVLETIDKIAVAEEKDPPVEDVAVPERSPAVPARERMRTIVIDPGHGGMDVGARGRFGALEKDVTLGIGLKLKTAIEKSLAFRVFMTRDRDVEVSLENRSALANTHNADLFVSIHANGSRRKNAQGSETFFLSLNATDEEARRLAYLENNAGTIEEQVDQGSLDDIKMILWDMAQSSYIKQSSRLAEIIQGELNSLLGTLNRGIKQAPFKVLTGVACPAVLVEVAFISNPEEEKKLVTDDFQQSVAEAILRGIAKYLQMYS